MKDSLVNQLPIAQAVVEAVVAEAGTGNNQEGERDEDDSNVVDSSLVLVVDNDERPLQREHVVEANGFFGGTSQDYLRMDFGDDADDLILDAAVVRAEPQRQQHQEIIAAVPLFLARGVLSVVEGEKPSQEEDYGKGMEEQARVSSYLFDMIREDRFCNSVLCGPSSCENGCQDIVRRCQEFPEEAYYRSIHGRNPIHEACLRNACQRVIRALLEANRDASKSVDNYGNTALHFLFATAPSSTQATRPNNFRYVDQVLEKLLEVDAGLACTADSHGRNTPLHLACMSETIVSTSTISKLLAADVSCASKMNGKNQTPLLLHCRRKAASLEVARALLEACPNALDYTDDLGWTAIHYAAMNGNLKLLRYIFATDPVRACARTTRNETALHMLCQSVAKLSPRLSFRQADPHNNAVRSRNFAEHKNVSACVEEILQVDPDSVVQKDSILSRTPLHLLSEGGDSSAWPEIVKLLLENEPRAATILDAQNYLPLHHACEVGCRSEIVRILLEYYPGGAKSLTRKRDSALLLACACNKDVDTINMLIDANPKALTQRNDYGFTPLHCVCRAYQPRRLIVETLLRACPESIYLKTNGGELPVHLLSNNRGSSVSVLQLLISMQTNLDSWKARVDCTGNTPTSVKRNYRPPDTGAIKIGNTPLNDACFRGMSFAHIHALMVANPHWIFCQNKAGSTPLHILCKRGLVDNRLISSFAQVGGPRIFSVTDSNRYTPLHSAIREETRVEALKCLIRANPSTLWYKTIYGDTPLHLACFRMADRGVVRELAVASTSGNCSLVMERNVAGQTPIGIAIEAFRSVCTNFRTCSVSATLGKAHRRVFQVLATLVKILFYGPVICQNQDMSELSLLHASLSLHRFGVVLDPIFIRLVIRKHAGEAFIVDNNGDTPLHIEAGISVQMMSALDGQGRCREVGRCNESGCNVRAGVLWLLLNVNPCANQHRNKKSQFPLGLMIKSGRTWYKDKTIPLSLRSFPPALHWFEGLEFNILPFILERTGSDCGIDTLFSIIRSRPALFEELHRETAD